MTALPTREEQVHAAPAAPSRALCWIVPSTADLFFIAILLPLVLTKTPPGLLADTSAGWHIRAGEHILRTFSIPRTDPFSYTMAGRPWYAWEWLWDALVAAVHRPFGLSGVVALAAFIIAVTFALLYRAVAERSGNTIVAVLLTLLSFSAASMHLLARPHIVSWLCGLFVLLEINRFDRGGYRPFWTLPLLFALWANLHGGFVIGLVVIATCGVAAALERDFPLMRRFAAVLALSAVATVFNPYGLKLHTHIVRYLASGAQINHIDEFLSPSFHDLKPRLFLLLVLIAISALFAARRVRWRELLLSALAIGTSLLAARNIPFASILLAYSTAPYVADWLSNSRFHRLAHTGQRMWRTESRLGGRLFPAFAVLGVTTALFAGYRLPSAQWDPSSVPVAGANYLIHDLGVRDHVLSQDSWGGYLIYSFGGAGFRVAVDDRSDLYGDSRFQQYLELANAGPGWRHIMDAWQIRYALLPKESSLSAVLAVAPDWRTVYSDKVATVFVRTQLGADAGARR